MEELLSGFRLDLLFNVGKSKNKSYLSPHLKKLLKENKLPDIRWYDFKSDICILLKNNYSHKAVFRLMGHDKELMYMEIIKKL